jgi:fructose-1,6-bisphosphatase/inositol monophosphatase family enzyme
MRDLEALNDTLLEGMLMCKHRTANGFGKAELLAPKVDSRTGHLRNIASAAVTEVDLDNQETILFHLYGERPDILVSVEERLNNPTPVQEAFYKNTDSATLVTLDALDGSFNFHEGLRPNYGIIGGVMERTGEDTGVFRSVIIYYPSLDVVLKATENCVIELTNKGARQRHLGDVWRPQGVYSAFFTHDNERLRIKGNTVPYKKNLYSTAQAALQLVRGEICGFLNNRGHLLDYGATNWLAKQWGADVEYASGKPFGELPFGDRLANGLRHPPRDNNGLVIVGKKNDGAFEFYRSLYEPFVKESESVINNSALL